MKWTEKMKGTALYKKITPAEKVTGIEWAVMAAVLVTVGLCFFHPDVASTVDNSILLLESVKNGEFFHYYDFCIGKTATVWAPNYEILMYLIFAVWNIPMGIAHLFFEFDHVYGFGAILWTKTFLILCLLLTAHLIYKICMLRGMKKERARLGQFLFLSSVNVMVPVFMISQCDIVNVFFMVLGIYMLLRKKTWKFILCFAIAIPLKMFAFFVFVPLVLLEEKKIMKAVGKIACGMGILAFCKLISSPSTSYRYLVGSFSGVMMEQMQSSGFTQGVTTFAVFIGFLVAVCIWAYMRNTEEENREREILYIPFMVFSVFFITFPFFPYWLILLAPFSALAIIGNTEKLKLNILLDTLAGVSGFLYSTLAYPWIFTARIMKYVLADKISPIDLDGLRFINISDILERYGIAGYKNIFFTVFVVAVAALVVINRPVKGAEEKNVGYRIEHSTVWVRIAALILTAALWFSTGIIRKGTVIFDGTKEGPELLSEISLLPAENCVVQRFKAPKTGQLSEISLEFHNEADNHINVSSIILEIEEEETGEILASEEIGTSMIRSNKEIYFSPEVTLEQGKLYGLKIRGNYDNGEWISPLVTTELENTEYPLEVNGTMIQRNLYMTVTMK